MSVKTVLHQPVLWIVLAALAIPTGYVAFAAEDDGDRPRRNRRQQADGERRGDRQGRKGQQGGRMQNLFRGVDLDEEQREEVHEVMKEMGKKHHKAREENQEKIDEIKKQIEALHKQMRGLMGGGPDQIVDALSDVLDEDQLAQVKKNIERGKQRRRRGGDGDEDGDRPFKRRPRRGGDDAPEADL